MKLSNISHIFFDLDHTLWDFDRNSALAFERVFKFRKIPLEINDFLKIYMPVNFKYWERYRNDEVTKEALRYGRLKDSFDLLKFEADKDLIDNIAIDYIEYLPDHNFLLDGSKEVLDYLHKTYELHIITNGFEEVQHKKLTNSGISKYFTTITTSEEAGVKKPNKLIFEAALQKSSALAENSIMIGDNYEADCTGAKNCGIKPIFFDYYGNKENIGVIHIKTLNELKTYL
ncbi:YjjG family noncanonical pyrimidine nucleotidase [Salegentibacter salegens]|uniref:Putative hydrolase of the HAD superfamily n=1 Tax=Salegentibacter salegens TaxID=143223 RepID=A0A1M7HVI2_9FLAO|nr:YjjG family noncanonical pyrimidine nucleotidase [Salegentibacter salegens]PRX45224.1 putative hydrolase of the HAD superfamily [Salegentibacter salegens]SHM32409.1 putative hydrolase of the HAD superfamily [Salegentibacter salegens]